MSRLALTRLIVLVSAALVGPSLSAQETVSRVPLGRAQFFPSDQIHVATVVGTLGVGVPGVSVSLSRLGSAPQEPLHTSVTDNDGHASFTSLEPGQYLVSVKAKAFLDTVVGPVPVTKPGPSVPLLPVIQVALNPAAGPMPQNNQPTPQ